MQINQNEIRIDMDQKCKRCGKKGATQSGYCLDCILKLMEEGKFDHIFKRVRNLNDADHTS